MTKNIDLRILLTHSFPEDVDMIADANKSTIQV